ncbi:alpha-ketoglutarate-dependent dioxygenase AlkB [Luteimonas sp. RD2P54]|uniref:Alpha-ketoglutarate-dependent dioxygenase AlkB n=1 Tax=Luteimonas endophytica TaxID=3042023 RepID=A0ABT6J9V1_9GAMM|nr:alpha-ketoglutarate-dependent dioxygenase AlkB [Luteimonas endophytica]MDH5822973.1 alpha-ketoglutarate-dependent dioxygenase AlkB [Luteimonas endophytica]
MPLTPIALPGADLAFDSAWLGPARADALFARLLAGVEWRTHRIRMFGREVDSPRRSCWIGDPGAGYRYSGARFEPHPWPRALLPLRARLRDEVGVDFNSVLANLYRDGSDRMGWHSDDEPELGPRPCIASVSLGAARRFLLKHREGGERLAVELPHGSLLLMRGDTQRHYRHALPATARPLGPRINLTFRRVAVDR